jgi:hypothetical protein
MEKNILIIIVVIILIIIGDIIYFRIYKSDDTIYSVEEPASTDGATLITKVPTTTVPVCAMAYLPIPGTTAVMPVNATVHVAISNENKDIATCPVPSNGHVVYSTGNQCKIFEIPIGISNLIANSNKN